MSYREEGGSRFNWFLIGLGIGAAVALMYAPSKGKDTRRLIGKKAEEARDYLVEQGEEIYEKSRDIIEEASDLVERGRKLARV